MGPRQQGIRPPGGTILGGAAGGFSYEGAWNDAQAREDAALKREAGHAAGPARGLLKPAGTPPKRQAKRQA